MKVNQIVELLQKWEGLGKRVYPSGTTYFGPIQAKMGLGGWLHQIFRPHDRNDLEIFARENSFQDKYHYPRELFEFNGAILFLKSFFLYGLHLKVDMQSFDIPWDLVVANVEKRKIASQFDGIIIGGADFGGRSIDYIESLDNEIIAFESHGRGEIYRWPNFDIFLRSEIARLNKVFDQNGFPPSDFEILSYS